MSVCTASEMTMLIDKLERAFVRLVLFFFGSLKVVGLENIPATGPYILAVNHMSKADPPLVMISWPPMARIRFFAGEKWEKHLIFGRPTDDLMNVTRSHYRWAKRQNQGC